MSTRTAAPVIITVSLVVLMSGCAGAAAQGGSVRDDLSPINANSASLGLARGHVIVRDDLSPMNPDALRELHSGPVQAEPVQGFSADVRRELHAGSPVQAEPVQGFSADVRRELHAGSPVQAEPARGFSADARRELHSQQPVQSVTVEQSFSAEAWRELKGIAPVGVTAAEMQGERLSAYAEAQAAADVTAAEMQGERLSAYAEAQERNSGKVQSEPTRSFSADVIRELKGSAPVAVDDDLSPLNTHAPTPEQPADTVDDNLSPLGASH